jgi:hypothetical protein
MYPESLTLKSLGNPGSILWLSSDRPLPQYMLGCRGVDRYKFGLDSGFPAYNLGPLNDMGREGIVKQYRGRNIHHLWGLVREQGYHPYGLALAKGNTRDTNSTRHIQNDFGPGDIRCQAMVCSLCIPVELSSANTMPQTQGRTHLERGVNFDKLLKRLGGPTRNTVSYVPGVSHNGPGMFQSDEGINKASGH